MGKILLVLLWSVVVSAQAGTYRWVDADGRVSYGDQPPPKGAALVQNAEAGSAGAPDAIASLPYAVRTAASRYPVRLYTSRDCKPCEAGRTHLIERGIPFTEKLVANGADLAEFKRLGFTEGKVPALSVGRERAQGYGAGTWNSLLDAAGYPRTSVLPRGWRPTAAQSLASSGAPPASLANAAQPGEEASSATDGPQANASAAATAAAPPQEQRAPENATATPATATSKSSIRF